MREKHREPEFPEEEVPVEECFDGHARITSKELALIHSVRNDTFQNACSTRPTVVSDLEKSALMCTARLKNSLAKGPKRMMTKVQWLCRRKVIGMKEDPSPTNVTIDQSNLVRGVDSKVSKYRSCNSTNSLQSFLVWKMRSKNQATTCSDFPSEAMLWIKEVERN